MICEKKICSIGGLRSIDMKKADYPLSIDFIRSDMVLAVVFRPSDSHIGTRGAKINRR